MKVSYINEGVALMWPDAMEDRTGYDIKQIVSDMAAVRTMKDVVDFILAVPPSFFPSYIQSPYPEYILEIDFGYEDSEHLFRGQVIGTVETSYPGIEILDKFIMKSGELGTYEKSYLLATPKDEDPVYSEAIVNPKPFYQILISSVESLIQNVQAIMKVAAIANGESHPDGLSTVSLDCPVNAKVIDSGLGIGGDMNNIPVQDPPFESYFTDKEVRSILKAVDALDVGGIYHYRHGDRKIGSIFIYPEGMPERDIAVNIFTSFMNSLFEGSSETMYSGNIFKVEHARRGFKVVDHPGPLRDMYRQVAYLAADKSIRLCAHCGKPLLANRSRGNEAMYCSRTCNTKASAQRRETAYALSASGVPLSEAVERIGVRYEQSVRRWYNESKTLLG